MVHRIGKDESMYMYFNKGGMSDLEGSSTSVDSVSACDGNSPMRSSVEIGLWTRASSLGEAMFAPALTVTEV
jgi:hypothetical protein